MTAAPVDSTTVYFSVLGPLRAWRGTREIDLGPRQCRLILASLSVRAGCPVTVSQLMDTMWPDSPPRSAINIIHRSVGALRRLLEPDLPARSPGRWILRHGQGYRLAVDAANLDLARFRLEHARARGVVPIGDDEALNSYLAALETWRGPCLADLDLSAATEPVVVAVNAEVSTVACEAADLALRIGRPGSLVTHLRRISDVDRYNETLHARLMHCLAADGHLAESLAVYDGLRTRLADELGVNPGNQLTGAYAEVRGYRGPVAGGHLEDRTTISSPPAQLPADVPGYVGRCTELARLTELTDAAKGDPDTMLTVVIDGMPGVGKSALAVHWGHQMTPRFPDGQLFLNLRGFDPHGKAMSTSSALRALLSALGVARQDIPGEPDAQAGLYRSLLAHRRMLIVLDNARHAHQVRDLLPGSPGCAAVITSRNRLHLLAVSGAEMVRIGLPDADQAKSTLMSRLGMRHAMTDPAAATEIVERCGRLPLALAIVAARVVANPGLALSAIADELAATQHRLDCFDNGDDDCDLRTVFSWSVDQLPQPAQRLFRLLALHGGGSFSAAAAASIAGYSLQTTRHLLQVLAGSSLLMEQKPGRFAFHDLLQAYATELVMEHEPECERQAALRRLFDHYRHTSHRAHLWFWPSTPPVEPDAAASGVTIVSFEDYASAKRWFDTEHEVLADIAVRAARGQLPGSPWQLAVALQPYWQRVQLYASCGDVMRAALTGAQNKGDLLGQAITGRLLAGAVRFHHRDRASEYLHRSLALFEQVGDAVGAGLVHENLGTLFVENEEPQASLPQLQRALEIYQRSGRPCDEARTLFRLAGSHLLLGKPDDAKALTDAAKKRLCQDYGDENGTGYSFGLLGQIRQERLDEVSFRRERKGGILASLESKNGTPEALESLGDVYQALGKPGAAIEFWVRALHMLEDIEDPGVDALRKKISHADDCGCGSRCLERVVRVVPDLVGQRRTTGSMSRSRAG